MKRKVTVFLTALMLLTGMTSWGQLKAVASIDFSEQGYANTQDFDEVTINIDDNVAVTFSKGSGTTSPKYYNTGSAIRCYGGNTFTINSTAGDLTAITLTFGEGEGSNEITTNVGTFNSPGWSGETSEVVFSIGGTTGNRRIKAISVIYSSDGTQQPSLTASSMTLTSFGYDFDEGGPSEIQYFLVGGDQLTHEVSILPSESFEISTFPEEIFHPENPALIYIPNSGHFSNVRVYVRMKAGLEIGTYDEQIAITSVDADTLFVNVSGTVTGVIPTPTMPTDSYVRIDDLSILHEGARVVFAARFDSNATDYYAMKNTSSGKPVGVLFTSTTSDDFEILPSSITDEENTYYWTVGVTANGYTFTNAIGELIGYTSSTNFATGGNNTEWAIELSTAGGSAMVPEYTGFVINNVNNPVRAFALNNYHNFGPYNTQNQNSNSYNFYLDLFVKSDGDTPVVAMPTFTPEAGTYFEAQTVSIACTTQDATIYYSTVSENGPWSEYNDAISVDESMTIWAYATKDDYEDSNVASATYIIQTDFVTIFNQDWEGDMNGWTFISLINDPLWTISQYNNNHYAYANGYNQGENEDWCISPAFNLDDYDNPILSFLTAKNYTGYDLEVYFSNNYNGIDPIAADWTQLTCELSPGGWTWTESGNISLSQFSGSNCYIAFVYYCDETTAAAWEVDDILLIGQTSNPVIMASPMSLTGFTYFEGDGPSDDQSFIVSALNLSTSITSTETEHFEISSTGGENFTPQSTITLDPIGGNVAETPIYVRMKAGFNIGDYAEFITIASTEATSVEVSCSGSVIEAPVIDDDYVRITDVSALLAGNRVILASRYNSTDNAYLAIANTLTNGKPATTAFTSTMNEGNEIIPAEILIDENNYYWTVDITPEGFTFTNALGEMIGYGNSGTSFIMGGEKTTWTITSGVSDISSLVPEYFGFNIANAITTARSFALRLSNGAYTCGAYHESNMSNEEYNFFFDIFMQGEAGLPTVAAPTFNPGADTYYAPQEVSIHCATNDATIHYSTISEEGPWTDYTEAIAVDGNMTIWAYATKDGYNDSPVVSAEYVIQSVFIIFDQDWEEDWHGWTSVNVEGEAEWTIAEHEGNHYAYMNGYNHGINEDWLISPAFNLDSYDNVVLTFRTAKNYNGPDIEVFFSNDYDEADPSTANWVSLDYELSPGNWTWTQSGNISLDNLYGTNCYIAFKYTCSETEAAAWEVDNIMLISGGGSTGPTLTAAPNTIVGLDYTESAGPSDSQSYVLMGTNLVGSGNITITASDGFLISQNNIEFLNSFNLHFENGQIDNQPVPIYVRMAEGLEAGPHSGTITHNGGEAFTEINLAGTVHGENDPFILDYMPYYIQGNNGSNNNRVPVATAAYVFNLEPNTTYRYTNQFVVSDDDLETAGAGNVIYASYQGFYRSTSQSLAREGGYGEFTTDEDGIGFAWFMNEPTANVRFTPGNEVYLRIRINDGHDGTTAAYTFTTEDYATVLNFGTENNEYSGSAFYAKSNEAPMSFAMLLASEEDDRPLYSTSIETTGVGYGSINSYADFYKEEVAGKDGWFGGILPNVNETGVNAIWILDIDSYYLNEYYTIDGEWYPEAQTINPNAGLDAPIFIDLTENSVGEAVAANVKVWSANHEFVVENGDEANYTMTVYNVLGQPMMQHQVNAGSTQRFSHSLATGIYVISLQNNQNKVSVKVFVR